jgi:hypothetical protein
VFFDHLGHQQEGEPTILQSFAGETEDKVHMRREPGLPDPATGSQGLLRRMPAVETGKDGIAAGLGSEDNGLIPAVCFNQLQNFRMNPIWADFRREASEMNGCDPGLPAGAQEFFDRR